VVGFLKNTIEPAVFAADAERPPAYTIAKSNSVPYLFVQTRQSRIPLLATDLPRNSWRQTHQDDEARGGADDGRAPGLNNTSD
jgi:hypothetical protein